MENFKLTNLFTIKGIAAPSGLLYTQNVLFIISDSSNFLYQYDIAKKLLLKFPLVKDAKENIEKAEKPDLESITQYGNQLIMLGSGSTEKRNSMFTLDLGSDALQSQDLSALYQKLKDVGSFSDDQLNIEGAIYAHQTMLLFQRGNSKNSRNGIFIIPNNQEDGIRFVPISLPTLDDIETTFTDAILVNDKIYFLACAENTESTYEDGEVLGTVLGIMHAPTFEIINVQLLSEHQKFEGITLYKESETEIEFLLCEDNDTETLETTIYQLTLKKYFFLLPSQPFTNFSALYKKASLPMDVKHIQGCRKQHREAQRMVYEIMAPKLYRLCKRYLKKEEEIEEVLADAFFTIFTKIEQLKEDLAFEAWARKITVNNCLLQIKKNINFNLYLENVSYNSQPLADEVTDLEEEDLLNLLQYIPDGCQTIFNLFVIEGYSHKEIAEQLGISEGTSKSQLNAAKSKLKELVRTFYYQKAK